ncbi:MAG TPA: hypothetical protein VEC13_00055 [Candidatus Paceibacterota bacterium]|nr:hypothetical protein [Candidatus Paceibacterota bacterium]
MYEEDKILGPLTFKQFLCCAAGALALYWADTNLLPPTLYILSAFIILLTILGIKKYQPKKISLENLEMHLRSQRGGKSNKDYLKLLKRRQADIQSHIAMRTQKGMNDNAEFIEAERILDKLISELPPQ